MSSSSGKPGRVITPLEFAPFERKVELRCQACGKKGKYLVGRIFVDPTRVPKPGEPGRSMNEAVGFTGYFHCRHCGAGGPWDFPPNTVLLLTALVLEAMATPDRARIHLAQMHLFDGTVIHSATEGEAQLKKRIEATPDDDFLWSRLGNLYDSAGEIDLASAAYEKAVELNPGEVESHYTLGCYLMDKKQPKQAAEHFTEVLRHCRTAPRRQPELLHAIVRDTLERLWELHNDSQGAIAFLPPLAPVPGSSDDKVSRPMPTIHLNLSTGQGWEELVAFYLTGQFPASAKPRPPASLSASPSPHPPIRSEPRVGRNDRCPCGSGKKFKHCCGRGR